MALLPSCKKPFDCFRKALSIKRLQQVVQSIHIKCLDGVFVKCRRKYHSRQPGWSDGIQDFKAVAIGYANVEEHQIGNQARDGPARIVPVSTFCNDLEVCMLLEESANLLSGKRLVIDDEDTNRHELNSPE